MKNKTDEIAKKIYDHCLSCRKDNKSKNPRETGCSFDELFEESKNHYRAIAEWHTENK